MRVAAYDDVDADRDRIDGKLREVVDHEDADATDFEAMRPREATRPWPVVVVTAHRGDRRDLAQALENPVTADVAGMHDPVASLQRRDRLVAQQAVRIRHDAHDVAACRHGLVAHGAFGVLIVV